MRCMVRSKAKAKPLVAVPVAALAAAVFLGSLGLVACTRARNGQPYAEAQQQPQAPRDLQSADNAAAQVTTTSAEIPGRSAEEATPEPREIDVPGGTPVLVVRGRRENHRPIVHLHGMCEDPRGNLAAWGAVAKVHGTIIALHGDVPCPGTKSTRWSDDARKHDARIVSSIEAANAASGTSLDAGDIILVGESMGAARAESLAKLNPERYSRLVLVGSPQVASAARLRGVRAVANLAGEREGQHNAKASTRALEAAGVATQFWQIPGATHGDYGSDGERLIGEALAFVAPR